MARTSTPSVASARPRRTPLNQRNRLSVKNKEEGFTYRIVNDDDDRIEQLKEQGYELCDKEHVGAVGDKRVDNTSSLGSAAYFSVGQGMKAVVMRIPTEWANEDAKLKEQAADDLEQTMKDDARKAANYGSLKIE